MILLTCMQSSLTLALPEQPTWCRSSARRKALAFAKHGGNPILFRSPELTASLDPPSVPASGGIPPPLPPYSSFSFLSDRLPSCILLALARARKNSSRRATQRRLPSCMFGPRTISSLVPSRTQCPLSGLSLPAALLPADIWCPESRPCLRQSSRSSSLAPLDN